VVQVLAQPPLGSRAGRARPDRSRRDLRSVHHAVPRAREAVHQLPGRGEASQPDALLRDGSGRTRHLQPDHLRLSLLAHDRDRRSLSRRRPGGDPRPDRRLPPGDVDRHGDHAGHRHLPRGSAAGPRPRDHRDAHAESDEPNDGDRPSCGGRGTRGWSLRSLRRCGASTSSERRS